MRKEVMKRLVDHEVYVARFYLKNDHPKAAAIRIEWAIKHYPGSGREPELLYSLGETYLHMDDPLRAKETFTRVRHRVRGRARRPAARSSTSSTSPGASGPNPPPKPSPDGRPARPMAEQRTARTCARWWRAGAPTTRPARTPRPSPA